MLLKLAWLLKAYLLKLLGPHSDTAVNESILSPVKQ